MIARPMKNSSDSPATGDAARTAARWITVDPEHQGQRLDNFLMARLRDVPRTSIYRMVRRGEVRVNSGRVSPGYRICPGDRVRIPPLCRHDGTRTAESRPEFPVSLADRVLFEDDHLLILDKPTGLAVHSGSGLRWGLIDVVRRERPELRFVELVHRLDRDTSGCLILAKRRAVLTALHADLRHNSTRNHRVDKRYLALLCGQWTAARARVVTAPLRRTVDRSGERRVVVDADGQYAKSVVRLRGRGDAVTFVEIQLYTGRTHQARQITHPTQAHGKSRQYQMVELIG